MYSLSSARSSRRGWMPYADGSLEQYGRRGSRCAVKKGEGCTLVPYEASLSRIKYSSGCEKPMLILWPTG